MNIATHHFNTAKIAEVTADDILIHTTEDGLQLMGDLYYQGFDQMILHEKNITPDFFDLKTGIAGEILQKFSNYRMRLYILGEFDKYPGKAIKDFIYESNNGRQINFLNSLEQVKEKHS